MKKKGRLRGTGDLYTGLVCGVDCDWDTGRKCCDAHTGEIIVHLNIQKDCYCFHFCQSQLHWSDSRDICFSWRGDDVVVETSESCITASTTL